MSDNNRSKLEKAYPLEKFISEFFILNESGNPLSAWEYLMFLCSGDAGISLDTPDGRKVSPSYCKTKYKQYVEWWNNKFGEKDPKYRKKEDDLMTIEDWFNKKGYMNSYKLAKTQRDQYIFGGYSKDILLEKVQRFEELLNKKEKVEVKIEKEEDELIVEDFQIIIEPINPNIVNDDKPF